MGILKVENNYLVKGACSKGNQFGRFDPMPGKDKTYLLACLLACLLTYLLTYAFSLARSIGNRLRNATFSVSGHLLHFSPGVSHLLCFFLGVSVPGVSRPTSSPLSWGVPCDGLTGDCF